ncbi:MAG: LysR family transcriptional regulator [Sphingobium sp.]
MNWDSLQIFLNVARHGNLVRAARALKVDPTTVSRRISALEAQLQQTLFERTSEGFTLTAYGRALLPHAEEMELAFDRIERVGRDSRNLTGQLRISVSEGFGTHFIAPRLKDFASLHPQLETDLVASTGFLNPSRREADLAILLTRPRRGLLKVRKLTDYSLALYAPKIRSDWQEQDQLETLRQGDIPIVGYIPDFIYAPELRYLDEIESGLEASIRCSSINAQREMIAGGAGIGVLPCFMADQDDRLTRIAPDRLILRSFWLAMHKDVSSQPRVRAFIGWLSQQVVRDATVLWQNNRLHPEGA